MKNYLLPLLLLGCFSTHAQSPDLSWVKQFGGTGLDRVAALDVDAGGNMYTSGYFSGTADFDPGPGTLTLTAAGVTAAYISKMDAAGNLLWAKQIDIPATGTNFYTHVNAQVLCPNGDLCITGIFLGAIDFDPGAGNFFLAATQSPNAFVARYDAQGALLWAKSLRGKSDSYGSAIALDASNNIYTTGFFIDTVDFDPGPATFTLATPAGNHLEPFISKLDAAGNFLWAKQMKTLSGAGGAGADVTIDASGNIYTTGSFIGTMDFDPGAATQSLTSMASDQDTYVSKLDAAGNFLWTKMMGGPGKDGGNSLMTDAAGNACLTGFFTGSGDFDPGTAVQTLTSNGLNDIFYMKLNPQGNLLWANSTGGSTEDTPSAIALDAGGNMYSTGYFSGAVDFDPGPAGYTLSSASRNAFISKFDGNGNFKWTKQLTSTAYNAGNAVVTGTGNTLYIAGTFSTVTDFDPNTGTTTLTTVADEDIFVMKLFCTSPPDLTVTASPSSTTCAGSSATLSASGASTYSWNAGSSNPFAIAPVANTNYTLVGKDINGCSSVAEISQYVSTCTGMKEISGSIQSALYPNPSSGRFTISRNSAEPVTIQLINLLGETVMSTRSNQAEIVVEASQLPAGLYMVNIMKNNTLQSQLKLIKE